MKTLLQINVVANWGSTGRIAEEIGQVAMSHGWQSYIAFGRGEPKSRSQLIRIGTKWDVYFHVLATRLFDLHGLVSSRATRRLIKTIERIKPDVIHLHNLHGYYINYEILFRYLAKADIPVVWTLHDCWTFTGHCSHFISTQCYQWRDAECKHCKHGKDYPTSYGLCLAATHFAKKKALFTSVRTMTLVPVSEWLGGLVKQSFLKDCDVHRIYNGVDLNVFYPRENGEEVRRKLGIGKRKMLIGVASVWPKSKGLADFIRLRKVLSESEYAIVLVGLNKRQIESLPQGIIGIARTNSVNELAEYYSAADITLNLSYLESFGMTTVEGFACGTPGIVYNATASPELMDVTTGFVVEPGDIDSLSSAIRHIAANGKAHYSDACRHRAEHCFNKVDRYEEYVGVYEEVMGETHKVC